MSGSRIEYNVDELDRNGAAVVVNRKAREYQEDHPGTDLADAVKIVCREDKKLAARYLDVPLTVED